MRAAIRAAQDFPPVNHQHRAQCTQMQDHIKKDIALTRAQQGLEKNQMTGAAHGQKFRKALDCGQDQHMQEFQQGMTFCVIEGWL